MARGLGGDVGQGIFGGLAGIGLALQALQESQQREAEVAAKLMGDQGSFVPVSEQDIGARGFLHRLFGTGLPENTFQIAPGRVMQFQPYERMTEEMARGLGLTYPVTSTRTIPRTVPPAIAGEPMGIAPPGMPGATPETIISTQEAVLPGFVGRPISPKTQMELLRESARTRAADATAFRKEKNEILMGLRKEGVVIPVELQRRILAAPDQASLSALIPEIPPEQTLEVTINGQTIRRPAKEVWPYLMSLDRDRRFQIAQENSNRQWFTAMQTMEDRQEQRRLQERGLDIRERATQSKLTRLRQELEKLPADHPDRPIYERAIQNEAAGRKGTSEFERWTDRLAAGEKLSPEQMARIRFLAHEDQGPRITLTPDPNLPGPKTTMRLSPEGSKEYLQTQNEALRAFRALPPIPGRFYGSSPNEEAASRLVFEQPDEIRQRAYAEMYRKEFGKAPTRPSGSPSQTGMSPTPSSTAVAPTVKMTPVQKSEEYISRHSSEEVKAAYQRLTDPTEKAAFKKAASSYGIKLGE